MANDNFASAGCGMKSLIVLADSSSHNRNKISMFSLPSDLPVAVDRITPPFVLALKERAPEILLLKRNRLLGFLAFRGLPKCELIIIREISDWSDFNQFKHDQVPNTYGSIPSRKASAHSSAFHIFKVSKLGDDDF